MAVFLWISFGRDNAMCLRHFPEVRKLYLTPLQFSQSSNCFHPEKLYQSVGCHFCGAVNVLWCWGSLPLPRHVVQGGLVLRRHNHKDHADGQIPWRVAETCYGHLMRFRDHITVSVMKKRKQKCVEKLIALGKMINRNNKTNKLAIVWTMDKKPILL